MNTKLTLTIDRSVIEKAKKHAADQGRSLSEIIENYLKLIIKEQQENKMELTPVVISLKGSFKAPETFDEKKELYESLSDKYLSGK